MIVVSFMGGASFPRLISTITLVVPGDTFLAGQPDVTCRGGVRVRGGARRGSVSPTGLTNLLMILLPGPNEATYR